MLDEISMRDFGQLLNSPLGDTIGTVLILQAMDVTPSFTNRRT